MPSCQFPAKLHSFDRIKLFVHYNISYKSQPACDYYPGNQEGKASQNHQSHNQKVGQNNIKIVLQKPFISSSKSGLIFLTAWTNIIFPPYLTTGAARNV